MKKHILTFLSVTCILLSSCSDFLNVPLESNISTSNYFRSVKDFEMGLTGAYNTLISSETDNNDRYGSYFYGFLVMGRLGTDEMYINYGNDGEPEIGSYTYTPNNKFVSRVWYMMYRGIQRTCVIVDRMAQINFKISQADKDRILGEAHFLRAFYYFHLVRFYGEVPLVVNEATSVENVSMTKKSIPDVYAWIISDLKNACDMLPYDNAVGHANKYAAIAMLGKVYLQMSGYPLRDAAAAAKAKKCFEHIIGSDQFALIPAKTQDEYFSLFDASNEHSSEYIWDVEFSRADGTNRFGGQVGTTDGIPTPVNLYWSQIRSAREFYETFNENDNRRNAIARFRYVYADDGVTLVKDYAAQAVANRYSAYKFRHPLNEADRGNGWANWSNPINFPIIRYADVLLSYAEAEYRAQGTVSAQAIEYINMVRRRGYLKDIHTPDADVDINIMGGTQFEDALLAERGWELCFEGHRWVDLVRFGKLEEGVKRLSKYPETINTTSQAVNFKKKHHFFPIPQEVVDASAGRIKQNPEWL